MLQNIAKTVTYSIHTSTFIEVSKIKVYFIETSHRTRAVNRKKFTILFEYCCCISISCSFRHSIEWQFHSTMCTGIVYKINSNDKFQTAVRFNTAFWICKIWNVGKSFSTVHCLSDIIKYNINNHNTGTNDKVKKKKKN